jgi:hypothetical protein
MAQDSEFPPDSEVDFGCDYCAVGDHRWYHQVSPVTYSEQRETFLLRCPRCGVLYEHTQPRGTEETRRLTENEAEELFPGFRRPG